MRACTIALAALLAIGEADAAIADDLVQRFEQLTRDVAHTPTDATTIQARAAIVADWVDAVALEGLEVTLAAPGVRAIATSPPQGEAALARARELDALVREFALRHAEPTAIGTLTAASTAPFVAGSYATVQQTYTVGSRPVSTGGGFWIARHFQANYGQFQTDDPAGDGWVTIETDDPDVRFAPTTIMAGGPHGGFRGEVPALAFTVAEGTLEPGRKVTVTYGDTRRGGRGLRMPDFSSERMPFPLYVDLDGSGYWFNLPLQPIVVTGAGIASVHAFAPSVVAPGERFEVSVRAEDAWRNRATGAIPPFELLIGDQVVARTRGRDAIEIVEHAIEAPGVYWPSVRSVDGAITGTGNPIRVEVDPKHRIYWGETHGHSGYAEGIGTVDYFMRYARDDARLDFVTHSEHDTALDRAEWELMRRTVAQYDAPGRFIPYLGYEWTMIATNGGHHNVLYRVTEGAEPISALEFPTLSRLYQGLRDRYATKDVVVIPHAHNPGDYRFSDTALEPLVEIMSMHGNFEWFAEAYLSHGHEVGFVAASDDHLSHPGYSSPKNTSLAQSGGLGAVLAPVRTRDAIFDNLKAHRTYATTGERMIVDFAVNGTAMGGRAQYATERRIQGRVIGTAPIESVAIMKNGEVIWRRDESIDAVGSGGDQTFLLSFESESVPGQPRDMPRGWRHWRGTMTIAGATLVRAEPLHFRNVEAQSMSLDGNVARFATLTRGDTSSIRLVLRDAGPSTTLALALEDAAETGGAPPMFRPPARVPGGNVELRLGELDGGRLVQPMPFDGYADGIVLKRLREADRRDVSIEFTDAESPHQGDYYYMRVRQIDDAVAWSSPVWVGGYPHR
jgi:hypothetical protein